MPGMLTPTLLKNLVRRFYLPEIVCPDILSMLIYDPGSSSNGVDDKLRPTASCSPSHWHTISHLIASKALKLISEMS